MSDRIMLVGDEKSFMVKALIKELEKEDYELLVLEPNLNLISQVEDRPRIVLLYLSEEMCADKKLMIYFKDMIDEDMKDTMLYLIGNYNEVDDATKSIGKDLISGSFSRPINIKNLIKQMDEIVEARRLEDAKKRILVVDDDGTMLRTIKNWLSDKYQVFMVNSGMSAITFLAKNEVDLILLDYEMPITDGPKVLEMLNSDLRTSSIPVMFLTAKGDRNSVMTGLSLKPENYLLKTLPRSELIATIDDFFEQRAIKKRYNHQQNDSRLG